MLQGMLVSAARTVGTAAHIVVMLVIELVATMLVYTYLNLYHLSTFGYLVRLSRSVLDVLTGQLEYWLPVKANTAYATLIGELGPRVDPAADPGSCDRHRRARHRARDRAPHSPQGRGAGGQPGISLELGARRIGIADGRIASAAETFDHACNPGWRATPSGVRLVVSARQQGGDRRNVS